MQGKLLSLIVWCKRRFRKTNGKPIRILHQEETWVPLDPEDQIFHTYDGDVVPIVARELSMFGALVKDQRKRISPLIIINPWVIRNKQTDSDYKLGQDLLGNANDNESRPHTC